MNWGRVRSFCDTSLLTRDVKVSRPLFGLGLGLTVIGLGFGLGLMR